MRQFKDPMKGRTLYEQIRIAAKNYEWPDDAAHDAANYIVMGIKDNTPCVSRSDLNPVIREALRVS